MGRIMRYTRRDLGKVALATLPMAKAFGVAKINSKFGGVQIGAISYSFNRIASPDAAVGSGSNWRKALCAIESLWRSTCWQDALACGSVRGWLKKLQNLHRLGRWT